MLRRTMITAGAVLGLCVSAAAFGQSSDREWNRRIDGVLITPVDLANVDTGDNDWSGRIDTLRPYRIPVDIQVVFSVEAWGRAGYWIQAGGLDLSTDVVMSVNGQLLATERVMRPLDPALTYGDTGIVEGQIVCAPVRAWLAPMDVVEVCLMPCPRSAPEDIRDGDSVVMMTFTGQPIYWDRQISSLKVRQGGTPGWVSVEVDVAFVFNYPGTLDLSSDLELFVNGEPYAADTLAVPQPFARRDGFTFTFYAVNAEAGDEIEVALSAAPGSVPEMPGVSTLDSRMVTVPNFRWSKEPVIDVDDDGGK